jgi:hypothetical protein
MANMSEERPCTLCGTVISGLEVYQYAWPPDGEDDPVMSYWLCRHCYLTLAAEVSY